MSFDLDKMYRLPWNLADNASTWLEITTHCNLKCPGCYRENTHVHKSISEIEKELLLIKKIRKSDSIAIAGGEPLLHPDLIKIVLLIKKMGWKPCLVTNGSTISEEILHDLKRAGLYKISFHVDSRQNRPRWEGKTEMELNNLRFQYASLVNKTGKITCNFIATIYPETVQEARDIIDWARKNIDIVNALHFSCHRTANNDFDYYVQGRKVDIGRTVYEIPKTQTSIVNVYNIFEEIREVYKDYRPCAYLNGTEKADSVKWLFGGVVGDKNNIYGYLGPRLLEIVQAVYHVFNDRYFSVSYRRKGGVWLWLSWAWVFDKESRIVLRRFFRNFKMLPQDIYLQMISIVQPIDIFPDGRQNMCDGCPDQTIWEGKLVYSCRMDEYDKYGRLCQTCPTGRTTVDGNKFST